MEEPLIPPASSWPKPTLAHDPRAIVFGVAFYLLERGLAKALVKAVRAPTPGVATAIRSIGWVLLIVETVVVYLVAFP